VADEGLAGRDLSTLPIWIAEKGRGATFRPFS